MSDIDLEESEDIDLYNEDETSEDRNNSFRIIRNVLVGKRIRNPFCGEIPSYKTLNHIGNYILDMLKSAPTFVGQIDAKTGIRITFQEMREKSVKCALWLRKQRVCHKSIITVCTKNQLDAYIPFLAGLYLGCKVNPLDEYFVRGNLDYFLQRVKPNVIFTSAGIAMAVQFACTKIRTSNNKSLAKIVVFDHSNAFESLHSILTHFNEYAVDHFSCPKITMNETAMILFSSGTDDLPKAVDIPQTVFMAPDQAPLMCNNDIAIWFESFGFITGMFLTIKAIVTCVTAIKVQSTFCANDACKLIEKYKITWMFLQTDVCAELVKTVDLTKYDVSSLKKFVFGGSAVCHEIHASLINLLPHASVIQVYSLTETGVIAYQHQTGKIGSNGYVARNIKLKITSVCPSPEDAPLGSNMQDGWRTDWFKTGDIGYYDEDGNVFVTERANQVFKYKKKSISPMKIEAVLQSHPAVLDAVVVPVPYAFENQFPKAFITKVAGKEVTEEELKQLVVEKLDHDYELRAGVIFLSKMPRNSNGKIQRKVFHCWAQVDAWDET
ncbi:hypothetical protein P5V15_005088 [Pogonomyrmex californicus]